MDNDFDYLPPVVDGPSAWYGPEMSGRNDWIYQLTESEINEIENAIDNADRDWIDLATITREDFPLSSLGLRLASLLEDVLWGRGFAVVRGLPIERWTIRQ